MEYTRPEVEIIELDIVDVIQTSTVTDEGIDEGDNGTPGVGFSTRVPTI